MWFVDRLRKIAEISTNLISGKPLQESYYFDPQYFISVLSEIMYRFPKTYALTCSMIFDLTAIIPNGERKKIWEAIAKKTKTIPNNEQLRVWLERTVYIDSDDTEGWKEFFDHCSRSENKTLLYRAYQNEALWEFPDNVKSLPDSSMILSVSIKEKLRRAENWEVQNIGVNEPFEPAEIDPFEY